MADLYNADATGLSGIKVDANARRLLGDGASGVGPYTRFGTPQLQALKIISASINFTTTPSAANSNLYKAVTALQDLAEVYYVGVPTATGANQFIALVHLNKTDTNDGFGATQTVPTAATYENLEDEIRAALGTAEDDITITNSTLTGLTFN
jgi:hypothetical protein